MLLLPIFKPLSLFILFIKIFKLRLLYYTNFSKRLWKNGCQPCQLLVNPGNSNFFPKTPPKIAVLNDKTPITQNFAYKTLYKNVIFWKFRQNWDNKVVSEFQNFQNWKIFIIRPKRHLLWFSKANISMSIKATDLS